MSELSSVKPTERRGRVERAGFVLQPVFLVSLAGLVANDHVFKQRWPGFLTGKLSDVCGLAVLAMLAWAVLLIAQPAWPTTNRQLHRALVTVCVTIAVFFAAMTMWGPAAGGYRTLNSLLADPVVNLRGWLSGDFSLRSAKTTILHDPTDLLAIPILIPIGFYLRRKTALVGEENRSGGDFFSSVTD